MRELISSMMRLSGAVTMFGVEQAQNAMAAPSDTQAALVRLRETLDTMADSLAAKMDEPKRAALDSMSRSQAEMIDRTLGLVNLEAAGEFMKKTSESLSDVVGRPSASKAGAAD
jgi:hypothetical protein